MQLAAILAALNAANQLAQLIPVGIDLVEKAMPPGTPGKDKLAAFKQMVLTAIAAEQALVAVFDQVWPFLEQLVAAAVAAKKAMSGGGIVGTATKLS